MCDWKEVLEYIKDKKGLVEKEELWGITTSEVVSYLLQHGYIEDDYFMSITNTGLRIIDKK